MILWLTFSIILADLPANGMDARYLAVERLLANETDPHLRVQLVIKWFELRRQTMKPEEEIEVYGRLLTEEAQLRDVGGASVTELQRVLAWHFFEKKNYLEAITQFERLKSPTAGDHLAYGDSLLQRNLAVLALEQYQKALPELEAPAAYRMGWAYLQFEDFDNSLKFFDRALAAKSIEGMDVRKAAFRERIVPWVYQQSKDELSDEELKRLEISAKEAFGESFQAELKTMHEKMIEAYLARDFLKSAQKVQLEINRNENLNPEFQLRSAAKWIRIYRSRLLHDSLATVLTQLPSQSVSESEQQELLSELSKSIEAYEKILVSEPNHQVAQSILQLAYVKSFDLFPQVRSLDTARVNDAKIRLDQGDLEGCLGRLNFKSEDQVIESQRRLLRARCELRTLEKLSDRGEILEMSARLLAQDRVFEYFPETERKSVRDQLGRLFLSSLDHLDIENATLNEALRLLKTQSPWSADETLSLEVSRALDAIEFKKLMSATAQAKQGSADQFIALAEEAHSEDIAVKSLSNAALLEEGVPRIKACFGLLKYKKTFNLEESVNQICTAALRESLELATLVDWLNVSKSISKEDEVLLGIASVALQRANAESILLKHEQGSMLKLLKPAAIETYESKASRFQRDPSSTELKNPAKAIVAKLKTLEAVDSKIVLGQKEASKMKRLQLARDRLTLVESFNYWLSQFKTLAVIPAKSRAEFEENVSQLEGIWKSNQRERQSAWCYLKLEMDPFEQDASCESMEFADLSKSAQNWVRQKPTKVEISEAERATLASIRAQDTQRKLFLRLWTLTTSKSNELKAFVLKEWALEEKRADLLEMAMSLSPRSEAFYLDGEGFNFYYRALFQARFEALKAHGQASVSL